MEGCDAEIARELTEAGIDLVWHARRSTGEVPWSISGELKWGRYVFRRAWYYWVVSGPVPLQLAREMYAVEERRDVRVDGHCGCPPPEEYARPPEAQLRWMWSQDKFFAEHPEVPDWVLETRAVDLYHIDSQEGLSFFVRCVTAGCVEEPAQCP